MIKNTVHVCYIFHSVFSIGVYRPFYTRVVVYIGTLAAGLPLDTVNIVWAEL